MKGAIGVIGLPFEVNVSFRMRMQPIEGIEELLLEELELDDELLLEEVLEKELLELELEELELLLELEETGGQVICVLTVALVLLELMGSVVDALIVAVFCTVIGMQLGIAGRLKTIVKVRLWPETRLKLLHRSPVRCAFSTHPGLSAALKSSEDNPTGIKSPTVIFVAVPWPRFVAVMVYASCPMRCTDEGPDFMMARSAVT